LAFGKYQKDIVLISLVEVKLETVVVDSATGYPIVVAVAVGDKAVVGTVRL
jgi:hypothetical protein